MNLFLRKWLQFSALLGVVLLSATCSGQAQFEKQPYVPTTKQVELRNLLRESRAKLVRQQLSNIGIADAKVQDAVIEFAEAEADPLLLLRVQSVGLSRAVASENTSDAQIGLLLSDLTAGLSREKERRSESISKLKAKVDYSQNPLLEVNLTYFNVIGDECAILNSTPRALERLAVQTLPQAMKKLGVNDPDLQATLTKFILEEQKALKPLLDLAYKIHFDEILRMAPTTDENRRASLAELRSGVTKHQRRREKALGRLDAKIGYTKSPRLEATLLLLGILNDRSIMLDGFNFAGGTAFKRDIDLITGEPIK